MGGQLVDSLVIKVFGDPAVIGFDNKTLARAIKNTENRIDTGRGDSFNSFVICKNNEKIRHYKK